MPPLRFQLASDLHLETPLQSPSYTHFSNPTNFPIYVSNLFLLGDIGLAKQPQLFTFLSTLLINNPTLTIFYVLGNHEAYGTTHDLAIQKLEDFEKEHGQGRFYFMHRRRVDVSETITILGCTLWTHISPSAALSCATLLTDFNEERGIWDRSVEEHNSDHARDLAWLNDTVAQIAKEEPEREIVILTHHSPTTDARANDPRHVKSSVNDGFRTDLSREVCWTSAQVKMWAFGHTHYNCQFYDKDAESGRGKLVIANQKGYVFPGGKEGVVEAVVIEAGKDEWKVVVGARESKVRELEAVRSVKHSGSEDATTGDKVVRSGIAQERPRQLVVQMPPATKSSAWRLAVTKFKKMINLT